jgi:hypothetical protein
VDEKRSMKLGTASAALLAAAVGTFVLIILSSPG